MSATKSTNTGLGNGSPYRVPPEPNRWPAIGLAVGVHALLLAFLWIGVSWQNNAPVAVEAEIDGLTEVVPGQERRHKRQRSTDNLPAIARVPSGDQRHRY